VGQRVVDGNRGFADFLAGVVEQFDVALEALRLAGAVVLDAELF